MSEVRAWAEGQQVQKCLFRISSDDGVQVLKNLRFFKNNNGNLFQKSRQTKKQRKIGVMLNSF